MSITLPPINFDQFALAINFATGLIGAALGGYISFKTAAHFQNRSERQRQIALANSLCFRLMEVTSNIIGIKNQIDGMFNKAGGYDAVEKGKYWTVAVPLLCGAIDRIRFDSEEMALFSDASDGDFVMSCFEIGRLHNILVVSVSQYNHDRQALADELEHLTQFDDHEGGLSGEVSFNPNERPDLIRRIGEVNNLMLQIVGMIQAGGPESETVAREFNEKIAHYFSKEEFAKKIVVKYPQESAKNGNDQPA